VYAVVGPKDKLPADSSLLANDGYDWMLRALGVVCITSITLLNMVSVKWAIRVHDVLTSVKVLVLALISVTGLVALFGGSPNVPNPGQNWQSLFANTSTDPNSYASAMFKIFWAYDGWSNLNLSISELKNPTKNLPIAAGVGVTLVTALYLLANVAYLTVVPQSVAFASSDVLAAQFFQIVFGQVAGQNVLPIFVALAAYGAVSAMVFSASRVVFVAAKEGYLPFANFFGSVNERFGTPVNALLFNWAWTILLMLAPPPGEAFSFLVDLVGYPSWLFYGLSVLGLLIMRRSHPTKTRPFRVWPVAAVFFILIAVFLCIFPFVPPSDPSALTSGGIPYYLSALLGLIISLLPIGLWWVQVQHGGSVSRAWRALTRHTTESDRQQQNEEYTRWQEKLEDEDAGNMNSDVYVPQVPEWREKEVFVAV